MTTAAIPPERLARHRTATDLGDPTAERLSAVPPCGCRSGPRCHGSCPIVRQVEHEVGKFSEQVWGVATASSAQW
jgi:hypothetical protein